MGPRRRASAKGTGSWTQTPGRLKGITLPSTVFTVTEGLSTREILEGGVPNRERKRGTAKGCAGECFKFEKKDGSATGKETYVGVRRPGKWAREQSARTGSGSSTPGSPPPKKISSLEEPPGATYLFDGFSGPRGAYSSSNTLVRGYFLCFFRPGLRVQWFT